MDFENCISLRLTSWILRRNKSRGGAQEGWALPLSLKFKEGSKKIGREKAMDLENCKQFVTILQGGVQLVRNGNVDDGLTAVEAVISSLSEMIQDAERGRSDG